MTGRVLIEEKWIVTKTIINKTGLFTTSELFDELKKLDVVNEVVISTVLNELCENNSIQKVEDGVWKRQNVV